MENGGEESDKEIKKHKMKNMKKAKLNAKIIKFGEAERRSNELGKEDPNRTNDRILTSRQIHMETQSQVRRQMCAHIRGHTLTHTYTHTHTHTHTGARIHACTHTYTTKKY